jgi:hypothetical protein
MVYIYFNFRLYGAVAQLGARLNGIQKVVGSNPISSIFPFFPFWLTSSL